MIHPAVKVSEQVIFLILLCKNHMMREDGPYYTQLGAAASVDFVQHLMEVLS